MEIDSRTGYVYIVDVIILDIKAKTKYNTFEKLFLTIFGSIKLIVYIQCNE